MFQIICIHEDRDEYKQRKIGFEKQISNLVSSKNFNNKVKYITSYSASDCKENKSDILKAHSGSAGVKSCFFKHYDALKYIAKTKQVGLILEDDSIFKSNLLIKCEELIENVKTISPNFHINIEFISYDVPLDLALKSQKKLVRSNVTKRLGGYLVSPLAAFKIVTFVDEWIEKVKTNKSVAKFDIASDALITRYWKEMKIDVFWSIETLVIQGSKTGRYSSDLSNRKRKIFYRLKEFILFNILPFTDKTVCMFRKEIRNKILEVY